MYEDISNFTDIPPIENLNPCETCKIIEEQKKKLAYQERKIVESLADNDLNYAISYSWWQSWISYVRDSGLPPGKINNGAVSDESGKLKPNARIKYINSKIWSAFIQLYDSDFEIFTENKKVIIRAPIIYELENSIQKLIKEIKEKKLECYEN